MPFIRIDTTISSKYRKTLYSHDGILQDYKRFQMYSSTKMVRKYTKTMMVNLTETYYLTAQDFRCVGSEQNWNTIHKTKLLNC